MQVSIPSMLIRGGTSKGLYFKASDLPSDTAARDRILLAAMGSPDIRQIDGLGGAHPLTSKVAIVSPSADEEVDVEYLFLQVVVDKAITSDAQNCGNILAGVGPFAIESGMVKAGDGVTDVRIRMLNSDSIAVARLQTPDGQVEYEGDTRIDGVPGTAAPLSIDFKDIAGSNCGALLPTRQQKDVVDGVEVTCIDNGMPVVLLRARDFGLAGDEAPEDLEANTELKARIEAIRLAIAGQMNLGNVKDKTVPKMCLISAAKDGGTLNTRTFIPHRVHEAIGVLGAVSVATACFLPGSVTQDFVASLSEEKARQIVIEHPTGSFTVEMEVEKTTESIQVNRAALLRTARLLMRGEVYIPAGRF